MDKIPDDIREMTDILRHIAVMLNDLCAHSIPVRYTYTPLADANKIRDSVPWGIE